jgi:hypothetical protein
MYAFRLATLVFLFVFCTGSLPVHADDAVKPSLRWTSKQEKGLYGYIIYRSENHSGPFLRINRRIVPRQADSEGKDLSQYQYVDESADAGKVYFYYIDAIATTGRKQRLTPVVRKAPSAEK